MTKNVNSNNVSGDEHVSSKEKTSPTAKPCGNLIKPCSKSCEIEQIDKFLAGSHKSAKNGKKNIRCMEGFHMTLLLLSSINPILH